MDVELQEKRKESLDQRGSRPIALTASTAGACDNKSMELRLAAITYVAKDTNLFELRDPHGKKLLPFAAGAHIDLTLPNGLVRQYSLVNSQREQHRYVIGVKLDRYSRGGSRFMHESLRVGMLLAVRGPRNNFPLVEDASHIVLVAGGIGITPIWCIVQRLVELGGSWELHYACRNREEMAFHNELAEYGSRVHFHFDDESGGAVLDVASIVANAPRGAHFYCCGPKPMLAAFESATRSLPPECVHLEYFMAKEARATEGGFTIVLARSGKELAVPPGKTILQVVRDAGVEVESSCEEGICLTCATRVISGIPDHRDSALSPKQREENNIVLICCSGSRSEKLVLDL
jgi:ferredoxin-NADP reductase